MLPYKLAPLSETSFLLSFEQKTNPAINDQVIHLYRYWKKNPFTGFIESVPAYNSIAIFTNLFLIKKHHEHVLEWISEHIAIAFQNIPKQHPDGKPDIKIIPVQYGGVSGPDLSFVAERNRVSSETVIALHSEKIYRVYMMGFQPGFGYLGFTDEKIFTERKQRPVPVAAGSVALAGNQTGVYPKNSPGGWQVIGRTNLQLFAAHDANPFFLETGDLVKFEPVTV
jgi:inhibitor of KinA